MEEKIILNEYVRTRAGFIYKITNIDENGAIYLDKKQYKWDKQQLEVFIVKHSKQLIDLIEVGDIIEIFDVLFNDVVYMWNKEVIKALKEDIENGIQIKSIVTHEQFEAMKYKVEVN